MTRTKFDEARYRDSLIAGGVDPAAAAETAAKTAAAHRESERRPPPVSVGEVAGSAGKRSAVGGRSGRGPGPTKAFTPDLFGAQSDATWRGSEAADDDPNAMHGAPRSEQEATPAGRRGSKVARHWLETPTERQLKLIDAGALIAMDLPTDADRAFLARQLVQATLPHTDPGNTPVWSRRNGDLTLSVQQGYNPDGSAVGHPYGTIPRLLLYWITTEALRKKDKRLELGDTLGGFMRELGLDPNRGGARSDRVRLEQQMRRLFAARISFVGTGHDGSMEGVGTKYMDIAEQTVFWWDSGGRSNAEQGALWQSFVVLHQSFFDQITANPVPVDVRALRELQRSPLALDLYNLMSYQAFRAYKTGRPMYMTWRQMQSALGTSYADADNLKKAVKAALGKVAAVHPGLRIGSREGGIEVLSSSRPAIPERGY